MSAQQQTPSARFDWEKSRRVLEELSKDLGAAGELSSTEKSRLLEERARQLSAGSRGSVEETVHVVRFHLGGEDFVLESRYVRRSVPYSRPVRVPDTSDLLVGLVKARGGLLPVFDFQAALGVGVRVSDRAQILVLGTNRDDLGLTVDDVTTTMPIVESELVEPAKRPKGGELIRGMIRDGACLLDGKALLEDPRFRM